MLTVQKRDDGYKKHKENKMTIYNKKAKNITKKIEHKCDECKKFFEVIKAGKDGYYCIGCIYKHLDK